MKVTQKVRKILSYYESDCPGTKANICRMLMHGKLGGTGKMIILPVDQGFEHGPARSFAPNAVGYDPHYHYQLAIDAGLNAYAAPLGPLEAGADTFAGAIPTILKVNSSNSLSTLNEDATQAITGSVQDALRLGCSAIGYTIYPGSENQFSMIEQFREMAEEAKYYGLAVVLWSYARGAGVTKGEETHLDIIAYAAHMAALCGAHIIKVKPPSKGVSLKAAQDTYKKFPVDDSTLAKRVEHVIQSSFNGRRIVVFSGGDAKGDDAVYDEVRQIRDGGGFGSIIGRNSFQRPREDALKLLDNLVNIYKGKF